jgi:hypothetical protein
LPYCPIALCSKTMSGCSENSKSVRTAQSIQKCHVTLRVNLQLWHRPHSASMTAEVHCALPSSGTLTLSFSLDNIFSFNFYNQNSACLQYYSSGAISAGLIVEDPSKRTERSGSDIEPILLYSLDTLQNTNNSLHIFPVSFSLHRIVAETPAVMFLLTHTT